jgi:DNA polymerase III delta subunit
MQLKIFHGDNHSVLLDKIREVLKQYESDSISRYSLKSENFDQIIIALSTATFFAEKRVVIIEDADEKKVVLDQIPDDPDLMVIFFFPKELASGSKILKEGEKKKAQIVSISQPQDKQIFTFLDLLAEKNEKVYGYFDMLYKQYGGQYLLTMIIFQLRRLVLPSSLVPPFLKQKIELQQKKFSDGQLPTFYYLTLETEYLIKVGKVEEKTGLLLLISKIIS